jgi:SAM-dependent methyltransferase
MGMTLQTCRFLVEALREGSSPERVLTLGRQSLWVSPERLVGLLGAVFPRADDPIRQQWREALAPAGHRFETFLRLLGAKTVEAADASGYEGAELIHDFNHPLPAAWEQRYDWVLDGGTLEHIFNFPVALANCMRLVRENGRLFLFTPANNYCGHGFYQFSPELFFRVFQPENGFELERLEAVVDTAGFSRVLGISYAFPITGRRYSVTDPDRVGERVLLVNRLPTLLFVQARRVRAVEPLRQPPQQSDYVRQWATGAPAEPLAQTPRGRMLSDKLLRLLGEQFCREMLPRLAWLLDPLRRRRFFRRLSFANRRFYRPADTPAKATVQPAPPEHA